MGNYQCLIGIGDNKIIEYGYPPILRKPIEFVHDVLYWLDEQESARAVVPRLVLWLLDDRYSGGGRWKGWRVGIEGDNYLPDEIIEGRKNVFANPETYAGLLPSDVLGGVAFSRERGEYIKLHPGNIMNDFWAWKSAVALTMLIMGSADRLFVGDFPAYVVCPTPEKSLSKLRAVVRTINALSDVSALKGGKKRGGISPNPWYLDNRIIGRWSQTHVEILDSSDVRGARDIGDYIYWVANTETTPLPPVKSIFCVFMVFSEEMGESTVVSERVLSVDKKNKEERRDDIVAFRWWEGEEEMVSVMEEANCPTVWMSATWANLVLDVEMAKNKVAFPVWRSRKQIDWDVSPFSSSDGAGE